MMPAMSAGIGGGYAFGRAAFGAEQARNRYLMGNATGAEYAGLRTRSMMGLGTMPERRQNAPQQPVPANNQPQPNPNAGQAPNYQAQMDRNKRLGR